MDLNAQYASDSFTCQCELKKQAAAKFAMCILRLMIRQKPINSPVRVFATVIAASFRPCSACVLHWCSSKFYTRKRPVVRLRSNVTDPTETEMTSARWMERNNQMLEKVQKESALPCPNYFPYFVLCYSYNS